jgi:hypothetical protein
MVTSAVLSMTGVLATLNYWFLSADHNHWRRAFSAAHGLLVPITWYVGSPDSPIGYSSWERYESAIAVGTIYLFVALFGVLGYRGPMWAHLVLLFEVPAEVLLVCGGHPVGL